MTYSRTPLSDGDFKTPSLGDHVLGFLTTIVLLYFVYTVSLATVVPYLHSFFLVKTDGAVRSVSVGSDSIGGATGGVPYVGNTFYIPRIEYTYSIGGDEIASNRYSLAGRTYDSVEKAKTITSTYRVGEKVSVWYSGIDHRYAVLDPQVSYAKATAGGVFLIFCIAVIWRMIGNLVQRIRGK